jgi:hypothetical protein
MKIRQDEQWHHDVATSELRCYGRVITTESGRTGDRRSCYHLIPTYVKHHFITSSIKTIQDTLNILNKLVAIEIQECNHKTMLTSEEI